MERNETALVLDAPETGTGEYPVGLRAAALSGVLTEETSAPFLTAFPTGCTGLTLNVIDPEG